MINEFHAALVNQKVDLSLPGADYVPADYVPAELSLSAAAVHRTLMVNPRIPEACSWRAMEIRRLLPRTDLASMLSRFDARTGYEPSSLVNEMATAFKPLIQGSIVDGLTVSGQLLSDTYRLFSWTLVVDESTWVIRSSSGSELQGEVGDNPLITTILPGTDNIRVRFVRNPGTYKLDWASRPKINIAKTAEELVTSVGNEIRDLVNNTRSRWTVEERRLFGNIIFQEVEPAAKVCAAALLLAGHILYVDHSL